MPPGRAWLDESVASIAAKAVTSIAKIAVATSVATANRLQHFVNLRACRSSCPIHGVRAAGSRPRLCCRPSCPRKGWLHGQTPRGAAGRLLTSGCNRSVERALLRRSPEPTSWPRCNEGRSVLCGK